MSPFAHAVSTTAPWIGTWARPPDRPAQVALVVAAVLAIAAAFPRGPRWLGSVLDFASFGDLTRRRRFLTVVGFAAAFLSLGYIAFYLRGGPRDAFAPVYWIQGHALSHGELAWTVPEPSASFRARDMLFPAIDRAMGIFAPGYPLMLAAGFLVGAPMLVGPALAAGLVLATWLLARELAADEAVERREAVARVAVGLSVVSAALRMHTADVLPYGATAAEVAVALAAALRARRLADARFFGVAGLAVGAVLATQPSCAVAIGGVVAAAALAIGPRERRSAIGWSLVALLPGLLVLLGSNHAAIGRAFASPAGAGSYFAAEPRAPLGARAAMAFAVQRLRVHLLDVDNLEPLALLALVPVLRAPRSRPAGLAALAIAGQLVIASPVDPTTVSPGAGARLLIAVVPIEHALVALGLARLFPRALPRAALGALALALAGFAVHASYDHERLAGSDLGRPRYEPDVPREASIKDGLLFMDDDQGFELAFDPGLSANKGVEAVRMRGDDHDRLLYDLLGHPQSYRYAATTTAATVTPWTPPSVSGDAWRFEAESDWPVAGQSSSRVEVVAAPAPCVSNGKVLSVTPLPGAAEGTAMLELPVPRGSTPPARRTWAVVPRVLERGGGGAATLTLVAAPGGPPLAEWSWKDDGLGQGPQTNHGTATRSCVDLPARSVALGGEVTRAWLVLRARGGPAALDKTTLRPR